MFIRTEPTVSRHWSAGLPNVFSILIFRSIISLNRIIKMLMCLYFMMSLSTVSTSSLTSSSSSLSKFLSPSSSSSSLHALSSHLSAHASSSSFAAVLSAQPAAYSANSPVPTVLSSSSSLTSSSLSSPSSSAPPVSSAGCPSAKMIHLLSNGLTCDCSPHIESRFGGWEITCYAASNGLSTTTKMSIGHVLKMNATTTDEPVAFGAERIESTKEDTLDLLPMASNLEYADELGGFQTIPVVFVIKYLPKQALEIDCHEGHPIYRPAMFQGFGIDEIDSFRFHNCRLPDIPLHLVLHRTSLLRSGETRVSRIRSLRLETLRAQPINVTQFRNLFQNLEQLEHLTIENYELITTLPSTSNRGRRIRRETNGFSPARPERRKNPKRSNGNGFPILTRTQEFVLATTPLPTTIETSTLRTKRRHSSNNFLVHLMRESNSTTTPVTQRPSTLIFSETVTSTPVATSAATELSSSHTFAISNNSTSNLEVSPSLRPTSRVALLQNMLNKRNHLINKPNSTTINDATVRLSDSTFSTPQPSSSASTLASTIISNASSTIGFTASAATTVAHRRLQLSFAQLFPAIRSLQLRSFLPNPDKENAQHFKDMLMHLRQLESLELSSNLLTVLVPSMFATLIKLRTLYLSHNQIEQLHPLSLQNLRSLEGLEMLNNQLQAFSGEVFQDLINLRVLRLRRNRLMDIPGRLLQTNTRLQHLDLSQNTQLNMLPDELLFSAQQLQNLSLVDCGLTQVSPNPVQFFWPLASLRLLTLRNNRLRHLRWPGLFSNHPQLNRLDLSYNDISEINPDVFSSNSSKLSELNLYGNDLLHLPDELFSHLRSLRTLNFGYNNLTEFPARTLLTLTSLQQLDLSRNQIRSLSASSDGSRSPAKESIAQSPFGVGGQLRVVNLANNLLYDPQELEQINWSLYLTMTELNLIDNQFQGALQLPVFYASRVKLDLRNNRLHTIRLDEWLLHRQAMETEDPSERGAMQRLYVQLSGNPIHCDCSLYPILRHAKEPSAERNRLPSVSFDLDMTRCQQPISLAGQVLAQLDEQRLTCFVGAGTLCPTNCNCEFVAARQSVHIDCRQLQLQQVPDSLLKPSNYESLPINNGHGQIDFQQISNVQLLLQHNRIRNIQELAPLLRASSSTAQHPLRLELFLDNNSIAKIPEDLFEAASNKEKVNLTSLDIGLVPTTTTTIIIPTTPIISGKNPMFTLTTLSLTYNRIRMLPLHVLDQLKLMQTKTPNTPLRMYLGSNPYNCTAVRASEQINGEADCRALQLKNWLTRNYELVGDLSEMHCDQSSVETNVSSIKRNDQVANVRLARIKASSPSGMVAGDQSTQLIQQPDHVLCEPDSEDQSVTIVLLLMILLLVTLLLLVTFLYFRNRQTVLAFIYIHFHPIFLCLSFHEEDLDREKLYDAFVSYSSADRDVVMQLIEHLEKPSNHDSIGFLQAQTGTRTFHEANTDKIVPEMEQTNSKKSQPLQQQQSATTTTLASNQTLQEADDSEHFRLCIHERDWLPGQLISWNIINSVRNSRRTILILSRDFIESIWFQIEFHTAYYQMLEDKMDRLIVIVRGEIPDKSQLDKDLAFLLSTKTYLVWGEKWFWEKLRYSLPHKRSSDSRKKQLVTKPLVNGEQHWPDFGTYATAAQGKSAKSAKQLQQRVDNAIQDYYQLSGTGVMGKNPLDSKDSRDSIYSEFGMRTANPTGLMRNPLANSPAVKTTTPMTTSESGQVNKSFENFETQT